MRNNSKYELSQLAGLTTRDLRALWQQHYGSAPPEELSYALLTMVLAFDIQAKRLPRIPKEIKALQGKAVRSSQPRPSIELRAGARFMRDWNGVRHVVEVKGAGFEYQGQQYRSLSAIATQITGVQWSGPRFFGLTNRSKQKGALS